MWEPLFDLPITNILGYFTKDKCAKHGISPFNNVKAKQKSKLQTSVLIESFVILKESFIQLFV